MAQVNAGNHVATNFGNRTRQWVRWRLGRLQYIRDLAVAKQRSWGQLVLRAGTTPGTTAITLLPQFTTLQMPPATELDAIEALITEMTQHIGPLPVTERSLKTQGQAYLPWLCRMLVEYEAAEAAGQEHPKLFSILPQPGNRPAFIAIDTPGLHR